MDHEETPKEQIKILLSTAFCSSRNFYYHTSHKEENMSSEKPTSKGFLCLFS